MQKITTIAAALSLALTATPVVSTAAAQVHHKDPIAHIATRHVSKKALTRHGRRTGRHVTVATGPR